MNKILFVDDEQNILNSIKRLIRFQGGENSFEFALGGKQAVKFMQQSNYDILISDLNMPEMSGLELAATAKRFYPEIKVIILSGNAAPELLNSTAIDAVLSKPCEIGDMLITIEGLVD